MKDPAARIATLEHAVCELADMVSLLAARVDMPNDPSTAAKDIVLRCVRVIQETADRG